MDMRIDPEELRDAARRLLDKAVDRRAAYADAPGDGGAAVRAIMAEQGWMLLTTPAERDGLGQSFLALAPIYEELGRSLAPVAFAGTMAAADMLATIDAAAATDLLGLIGTGDAVVAIADGTPDGMLANVVDGGQATHLLLLPVDDADALHLVDLTAPGVTRQVVQPWDRSRTLADITLSGVATDPLLTGDAARAAAVLVRAHRDLAVACDSLGGGEKALEEAIAYMGTRQQFNRPIGSFQALKHRSADLKVGLEIARALTHRACADFAERREGWACAATQAKLLANSAYRAIAEESVQFHGGIGFTWEYDCHLFLKRALFNELLGDTPETAKDRIAPYLLNRALAA